MTVWWRHTKMPSKEGIKDYQYIGKWPCHGNWNFRECVDKSSISTKCDIATSVLSTLSTVLLLTRWMMPAAVSQTEMKMEISWASLQQHIRAVNSVNGTLRSTRKCAKLEIQNGTQVVDMKFWHLSAKVIIAQRCDLVWSAKIIKNAHVDMSSSHAA